MYRGKETCRGFINCEFIDDHGLVCSVQESSAIGATKDALANPGSSFLWLGPRSGQRMHLSRKQVDNLIRTLLYWRKYKRLPK